MSILKLLLPLLTLATPLFASSQATQPATFDTLIVHFASNEFRLDAKACATIDGYFESAPAVQTPRIASITGYCDNTGADRYNENLSLVRAEAVAAFLNDKWPAQSSQLVIRGLGSTLPVADNTSVEGRALNRRVVIVIHPGPGSEPPRSQRDTRPIGDLLKDTATHTGDSLTLKDVNFYGARHIPLPASLPILDQLTQAMNANPRLRIGIDGYVCCTPEQADGLDLDSRQMDLSVERAKYVYDYLIAHGIAKERLTYAGHGGANKLYPAELNEAEQSANRRVVIRVVAK